MRAALRFVRRACGAGVLGLCAYLLWPLPAPGAPSPEAGDCAQISLWSNGFHSDLVLDRSLLGDSHPLVLRYPFARSFMIGWGNEEFYISDGTDVLAGLNALIPPSTSVLHVVAAEYDVREYYRPIAKIDFAVSREGAEALSDYIRDELALDEHGAPIEAAPGKLAWRSAFLRGRSDFHALKVCNHWMAWGLRRAGLDVNPRIAWLPGPINQAAAAQSAVCLP